MQEDPIGQFSVYSWISMLQIYPMQQPGTQRLIMCFILWILHKMFDFYAELYNKDKQTLPVLVTIAYQASN